MLARGGVGPVGEGDPARTLTHRLVRLPAPAPRIAPLRCQPLASPPEAQGPVPVHEDGERSARAAGAWRAGSRGWGRWDARSGRRGHLRHDRRRLHSATEAAGPPTTPGPASAPPRRGATAVPTNQKPSRAKACGTKGAFAEGRGTRQASTAARLLVSDSTAQPIES